MEHNQPAVDDYLGPLNIPMILVLYYWDSIQFENWLIVVKNIWFKITLFNLMKEIPTYKPFFLEISLSNILKLLPSSLSE